MALIRQVFEEFDAPREGSVYSDASTEWLSRLFSIPGSELWVARVGGRPVGCCGLYPTPGLPQGWLELAKFYMQSEFRGKGIGYKLLQKCMERARVLGASHLYLESFPQFASAVKLYGRVGFQPLMAPLGASGHTACTIWMVYNLQKEE